MEAAPDAACTGPPAMAPARPQSAIPVPALRRYGEFAQAAIGPLLMIGLALAMAPTFIGLSQGLWRLPQHAHGPLMLVVCALLLAVAAARAVAAAESLSGPPPWLRAGACVLATGALALLAIGRSQSFPFLEVLALPPLLAALALGLGGTAAWREMRFAVVFLVFLLPWPASLTDALTQPLKLAVSVSAEALLHGMGYPVARQGVVLTLGPYRLLVADACSGLNSLFMLEAFGLLYLHVVRHASAWRNGIMAVLIVPVSFAANVVRVLLLALVTFHFGDAAAQGWLHEASSLLLFLPALVLTLALDFLLQRHLGVRARQPVSIPALLPLWRSMLRAPWRPATGLLLGVLLALVLAQALRPPPATRGGDLPSQRLPMRMGDWVAAPDLQALADIALSPPGERGMDAPYDDSLIRAYRHRDGRVAWVALAYSRALEQEVKLHRPELCYQAAGVSVRSAGTVEREGLRITRLETQGARREAVSYWMRVGRTQTTGAWAQRWHLLREGLAGRRIDGLLVRTSGADVSGTGTPPDWPALEALLAQVVAAVDPGSGGGSP